MFADDAKPQKVIIKVDTLKNKALLRGWLLYTQKVINEVPFEYRHNNNKRH